MPLAITRTPALRRLRSAIGWATYRLNTAVVGLELVASGGDKPATLPIGWTKPPTLEKARQAADQARTFILTSALVYSCDAFESFMHEFAEEPWLGFSPAAIDIATGAVRKPGGSAYSIAERARTLCEDLSVVDNALLAAIDLFALWRNAIVHSKGPGRSLSARTKDALLAASARFASEYAGLDIEVAVKSFESKLPPSHKEAVGLISCTQNLARAVDKAALQRAFADDSAAERVLFSLLRAYLDNLATERAATAMYLFRSLFQGDHDLRITTLTKLLAQVGISEASDDASFQFPDWMILDLVTRNRDRMIKDLGIR